MSSISYKFAYAPSEVSDQPVHPHSLISLHMAPGELARIQSAFSRTAKTLIFAGRTSSVVGNVVPRLVLYLPLTHLCLASHKRDIGKQCRPRSDLYCNYSQPMYAWRPIKETLANSVDPDQTPQNAASDLGLQCFHLIQGFLQNMVLIKTNQTPLILEMDLSGE